MNIVELLTDLSQKEVQVWADDNKLRVRSPKGELTPELQTTLTTHKAEILAFLREQNDAVSCPTTPTGSELSLQTIGRIIGGFSSQSATMFKPPVIDPKAMAQALRVTFRPLPRGFRNENILQFRKELEHKLRTYGVRIEPWSDATSEFRYDIQLPFFRWKNSLKTRVIKAEINAVIDVERHPSIFSQLKMLIAEALYHVYCRLVFKHQTPSIARIAKLIGWAEEHAAKYVENPTSTQVIMLSALDSEFVNPKLPYQQKIKIGLNTLVRTFSEIVIGASPTHISILNMNLSDSIFTREEIDKFVLKSLIPKVFVPIAPLLLNRFEIGYYEPHTSDYANRLVTLGRELRSTGLFPPGFKLCNVIKRKSHRDIVDTIVNGRTGVSYGFVAYAEAPQYVGKIEISDREWQSLLPVEGLNQNEIRQNAAGRRYASIKVGTKTIFKQIPDIWLVSARSGSNKTDLNLESDVIRVGLKGTLQLQLPRGMDPSISDIKPSYDIYVMLAIALSAALYAPELIQKGTPIVHFHGYPALDWFKQNEYHVGIQNPSVPCGTYESGVFNFLGIQNLANQHDQIALAALIEPDHGTNIVAPDLEYLIERLKAGCEQGQIELGGKHFASLTPNIR